MAINRQERAAERLRDRQDQATRREEQRRRNEEAEATGAGGVAITDNREQGRRKSLAGAPENKMRNPDGDTKDDGADATDAARALAEENGIDLSQIQGTGEGGRITKGDVQAAIPE